MQRSSVGKAIVFFLATAGFALGAAQADARGGHRHGRGGELDAAASPYAFLEPITVSRTPGEAGRAAFEDGWSDKYSSCPPGRSAAPFADGGGWRCQ
jgi:hypothetical protein